MLTILKKEFTQFFTSPIGYISIGLFFIFNSVFLWIIDGNYNIPNGQFADLAPFFNLAPWIFIFVIAAISMRSFSEEFKSGSIETLITKPLHKRSIILGKFLAILSVGIVMLIPTLIYVYAVNSLSVDTHSLDSGALVGAYFGLVLLLGVFSAIGTFSSLLFSNQVNAFLVSLFIMFMLYFGLKGIGNFNLLGSLDAFVQNLSIENHYSNMVKGLLKLSDLVYMLSLIIVFIAASCEVFKRRIK